MRKLRDACFEKQRPVSLALDAFPVFLQKSLEKYMSKRFVLYILQLCSMVLLVHHCCDLPESMQNHAELILLVEFCGRLSDAELKSMVGFWPNGLWQEYLPLLQYCRAAGVRLMACGTPPEVLYLI